MNNGKVYELPDPPDYKRILEERGSEAYVRRLVVQYGPPIAASYDLRLFWQICRRAKRGGGSALSPRNEQGAAAGFTGKAHKRIAPIVQEGS